MFLLFIYRYRQTRFSSRRVRKRVVFKHGDCNVVQGNVAKRRRRYLQVKSRVCEKNQTKHFEHFNQLIAN